MKNQLMVKSVPFMGSELMAAKGEKTGKIHVGVSYVCRGIGLNKGQKDTQVEKIQQDLVLSRGCWKFPAGVFYSANEAV